MSNSIQNIILHTQCTAWATIKIRKSKISGKLGFFLKKSKVCLLFACGIMGGTCILGAHMRTYIYTSHLYLYIYRLCSTTFVFIFFLGCPILSRPIFWVGGSKEDGSSSSLGFFFLSSSFFLGALPITHLGCNFSPAPKRRKLKTRARKEEEEEGWAGKKYGALLAFWVFVRSTYST